MAKSMVRLLAVAAFTAVVFSLASSPSSAFAQDEQNAAGDEAAVSADADSSGSADAAQAQDETAAPDGEAAASGEAGDTETEDAATDEMAADDMAAGDGAEDTEAASEPAKKDWGRLQPVADLVEAGGPIIIILAALSIIALAIVIVKLIQFYVQHIGDHRFIEKAASMIERGDDRKALDFVAKRPGVIARVMEAALRGKLLNAPEEQVREEVERVAQIKLDGLERGLPLLSLIATVSPLLGLLGTVLGMISAFQQLENAGDRVDPAILSGGIWEALLTTAAGLSVAIPAAALFTWLQRSVDVAGQHMENAATRVFTADLYRTSPVKSDKSED